MYSCCLKASQLLDEVWIVGYICKLERAMHIESLQVSTVSPPYLQIPYPRSQPRKLRLCGCYSVAKLCPTLCDSVDFSTPSSSVHHLPEFAQIHVRWVGDVIYGLILCRLLLLLPSVFPSIRVFSNELAFCIRWPKYGSYSFSISPSSEFWGWISFSSDYSPRASQESSLAPEFDSINTSTLRLLYGPTHIHTWLLEKS